MRKRGAGDIWENLYEFVLVETDKPFREKEINLSLLPVQPDVDGSITIKKISGLYTQQLTHQTIEGRFIHVHSEHNVSVKGYKAVSKKALAALPFPKLITGYLAENELPAFER